MLQQPANSPAWVESPHIRYLIAGGVAGMVADLSLHPIDTLRTRLQSSRGFMGSGGFRGIYAGVGSAIVGSAPGAALFFFMYESVKKESTARKTQTPVPEGQHAADGKPWASDQVVLAVNSDGPINPFVHMVAAIFGETVACLIRVPTEVIKQRAQASQHPSSLSGLMHILSLRHKGSYGYFSMLSELYRGFGITVLREIPFTVIQFPIWEALKEYCQFRNRRHETTAVEGAVCGSVAGGIAAAITTPLDVLKTRVMLSAKKERVDVLLRKTWRVEGWRTFFSGIGPRTLWISGGGAIFLGSYQWALNVLGGS